MFLKNFDNIIIREIENLHFDIWIEINSKKINPDEIIIL